MVGVVDMRAKYSGDFLCQTFHNHDIARQAPLVLASEEQPIYIRQPWLPAETEPDSLPKTDLWAPSIVARV
jgi:hypothetical protein